MKTAPHGDVSITCRVAAKSHQFAEMAKRYYWVLKAFFKAFSLDQTRKEN